jgi:hypothetical protein
LPASLGQGGTRRAGDATLLERACDSSAQFVVTAA